MCGILGLLERGAPVDRDAFAAMLDTLHSRGPDGRGTKDLAGGRLALGHTRLAILDLSERGAQPMTNEDGTIWLTYNGEIYNYLALRKELEQEGHRFASTTDSEVIVHAYEQWGVACVRRLRGIFAFGLWDEPRQRLVLARDPLGVKPLCYADGSERFVFASVPRAILAHPAIAPELDLAALSDYLAYGIVPWDRCIQRGLRKLPPAHLLVHEGGATRLERYWALRYRPEIHDAEEALEAVAEKLEEVVAMQLASDVPVGAFLSGGIDSSLVTALAAPRTRETLRTFTVGFHEGKNDERPFARKVVDHFGTDHHESVLDRERAIAMIPELIEAFDEPYALGSSIPTLEVSRLARESHTKVVLGGDGGDEGFAGYLRYDDFARRFPDDRLSRARRRLERLLPVLGRRRRDPMDRYFRYEGVLDAGQQARLLTGAVRDAVEIDPLWRLRRFYDPSLPSVTAAQLLDVHTFLCDEILVKVDRASMSHGVEARVPLLDNELLELCFRISERVIYGGGQRKHLLKKAAARWMPPDVLTARKKGFSIPTPVWFDRDLRARMRTEVRDGALVARGIFDPEGVDASMAEPKASWHLYVIELWARRWLEGQALDSDALPHG